MRRKIAPILAQVVRWSAAGEDGRREYRALVAFVRCALRERESVLEIAKYARGCHPGEIDGDYVGRMLEDSDERMACALLRLDKASATPRGDR